ncbi:MAG: hypothetical protein ABIQ95_09530 [Bdellovibrionia bacterium]
MKSGSIYSILMFAIFAVINIAQAAEETIEIQIPVHIACSPSNAESKGTTGADVPNNGPYRFVSIEESELSRNPKGHNNYYGSYNVSYFPSQNNVQRINVSMYAKRNTECFNFFGWHGPRSWFDTILKVKLARTVPQSYLDETAEHAREGASTPCLEKYKGFSEKYSTNVPTQTNQLNTLLTHASTLGELLTAKKTYEDFVCPILNDMEDLETQARPISQALAAGIAEFVAGIRAHNNTDIKENILATMNLL